MTHGEFIYAETQPELDELAAEIEGLIARIQELEIELAVARRHRIIILTKMIGRL